MSDLPITVYTLPDFPEEKYGNLVIDEALFDVHSTISNVASIFENWYMRFFPKNYFDRKTGIWKNTQHEFRSMVRSMRTAKTLPMLFIDSDYEIDEDSFQSQKFVPSYQIHDDGKRTLIGSYTHPILTLPDIGISVRTNYYYSNFDLITASNSHKEMTNLYNKLYHRMNRSTFPIQRNISSEIPILYIKYIARVKGLDLKSTELIDLLNTHSNYPIKRIDRNSGNVGFYMLIPTTIQVDARSKPSKDSYTRDDETEGVHRVADIIRLRYCIPIECYLTSTIPITELEADTITGFDTFKEQEEVNITQPYFIPEYKNVEVNEAKYPSFTLSDTFDIQFESEEDEISIFDLLNPETPYAQLLPIVYPNGEGVEESLKVDIYLSGVLLDEGVSKFDIRPSELIKDSIYTYHVYVNMKAVNDYLMNNG